MAALMDASFAHDAAASNLRLLRTVGLFSRWHSVWLFRWLRCSVVHTGLQSDACCPRAAANTVGNLLGACSVHGAAAFTVMFVLAHMTLALLLGLLLLIDVVCMQGTACYCPPL